MTIRNAGLAKNGLILGCVIIAATTLRLYGITFGLPGIYDPDEPFFTMTTLRLLSGHSLNPGWFGHPGTTTIYMLAIIDACTYVIGHFDGQIPNPRVFGVEIFTNPAIVVLPGRIFIAFCGALCVWLTYLIGKRLFGDREGLLAAALLAVNPLHIQWSQIIRTDIHATVFMLLCVLCSINIARDGRLRHYLCAGLCVGLAAATKWPAASILICPIGACLLRAKLHGDGTKQLFQHLLALPCISVVALIIISPYLVLDYHTALANILGEASPGHLGASGGSFSFNLTWYLLNPIANSIGLAGLALAAIGLAIGSMRSQIMLATIIPGFMLFFLILCTQSLIWTRWVVPVLPFISLFIALGVSGLANWAKARWSERSALFLQALLCCGIMIPMVLTWTGQITERLNDTRGLATAWIARNIPAKRSIVVEYFAFDLLQRYRVFYPAGEIGCIYANEVLRGGVRFTRNNKWRAGRSIVNLGTIDDAKRDSCRADYAIFTDYDRYKAEATQYPLEIAAYEKLAKGGTLLKVFSPVPGEIGGPVVRLFKLSPASGRPSIPDYQSVVANPASRGDLLL